MGFFKNFMLKQALKAKMGGVPEAERERLLAVMEKHPEFFKKIGEQVQKKVKGGMDEMPATMVVMREHQAVLQKIMSE